MKTRRGFTMIELMVVVGIMLLLAVITASAVSVTTQRDKVRAAARQVQSLIAGARDRAIYAKQPRGVRLLIDPTNNRTVSSLVYIRPSAAWSTGAVQLERLDANNDGTSDDYPGIHNPLAIVLRGFDNDPDPTHAQLAARPTNWLDLYNRGMLRDGSVVRIPNDDRGRPYVVSTSLLSHATASGVTPYYPPRLLLTQPYLDAPSNSSHPDSPTAFVNGTGPRTYSVALANSILENADLTVFPPGTVIHLDRCTSPEYVDATPTKRGNKLPDGWKVTPSISADPSGFDYSNEMDIMFSPRGTVIGSAGQRGIIHLYLADQKDADRDRLVYWSANAVSAPEYGAAADKYERGDKCVLSVFTRTGIVATASINSNSDPFKFAETGEIAGK